MQTWEFSVPGSNHIENSLGFFWLQMIYFERIVWHPLLGGSSHSSKYLATMVIVFALKTWGCGTPNGRTHSMAYKWGWLTTWLFTNWDDPPSIHYSQSFVPHPWWISSLYGHHHRSLSEGQLSDANAGHAGDLNANARDRRVVETTQFRQMYLETEHLGLDVFFFAVIFMRNQWLWNLELFFLGGGGVLWEVQHNLGRFYGGLDWIFYGSRRIFLVTRSCCVVVMMQDLGAYINGGWS